MKAGKRAGEVQTNSDLRRAFDFVWKKADAMGIATPGSSVLEAIRRQSAGEKNGHPRKPKHKKHKKPKRTKR